MTENIIPSAQDGFTDFKPQKYYPDNPKYQFLSERLQYVAETDKWWIYTEQSDQFKEFKNKTQAERQAKRLAGSNWSGDELVSENNQLTESDIMSFMTGIGYTLDAVTGKQITTNIESSKTFLSPSSSFSIGRDKLVEKKGSISLNTYRPEYINPDMSSAMTDDETELANGFLNILGCGLAGHESFRTWQENLDILNSPLFPENTPERALQTLFHYYQMPYVRPGLYTHVGLALLGYQGGVGKNYVADVLKTICCPNNNDGVIYIASNNALSVSDTGYLNNRTMVFLDEIQMENKDISETLKSIRNTSIQTKALYKDSYSIPVTFGVILHSNHPEKWPAGRDNRRYICYETLSPSCGFKSEYTSFINDYTSVNDLDDVAHAVAKLFLSVRFNADAVKTYYRTDFEKTLIEIKDSPLARCFREIKENNNTSLYENKYDKIDLDKLFTHWTAWSQNNISQTAYDKWNITTRKQMTDAIKTNYHGAFTDLIKYCGDTNRFYRWI